MHHHGPKQEEGQSKQVELMYRHRLRREWGFALLAWERGEKRGYQFEDGRLRVFKKGYYQLLEEHDASLEEHAGIAAALRRRLGWKEDAVASKPKMAVESVPFERQLALFRELYPKGFQGARWAREKRGIDVGRRLQRHRDVAIVDARKLLSKSRINALLEEEDEAAVIQTMLDVGNATDLIPKAKLKPLERATGLGARRLSQSLAELLHGEDRLAIRFERFVDALARTTGHQPSWQLATFLLSLQSPKEQVCVKAATMRKQAACLGKSLTIPALPSAPKYESLRSMALEVSARLEEAGLRPRDLVDIYDFMDTTLSSKAMKRIEASEGGSGNNDKAAA